VTRQTGGSVFFLTDYGYTDEFAGVVRAVVQRCAPGAPLVDLTHDVEPFDVRAGALALGRAAPHLGPGVVLAVVDPEVGTGRRAVAVSVAGGGSGGGPAHFVGPDNGLLALAAQAFGGVLEAVDIGDSPECLRPISATFHGRDVFAPVAAALADGVALDALGQPIAPDGLVALSLPRARVADGSLIAHVLSTDIYGNVSLDATAEQAEAAGLRVGAAIVVELEARPMTGRFGRTFADVAPGELLAYVDARGALALAVNGGSAVAALAAGADDELVLRARTGRA